MEARTIRGCHCLTVKGHAFLHCRTHGVNVPLFSPHLGTLAKCTALLLALGLVGCAGMQPRDFAGREPRFEPEKYFAGRTRSWGVIEPRFGGAQRQFTAVADGQLSGNGLHLDQRFTFADGKTQRRIWTIRRLDDHRYEGTAADVRGVAHGEAYGNAFQWKYTLAIPTGSTTVDVDFSQWMLLQPRGLMLNRARYSKFGLRLGTVSEFFQKVSAPVQSERRTSLRTR